MEGIEKVTCASEKLTANFGRWPAFHDAEVHEVYLRRETMNVEAEFNVPAMSLKIDLWEMTSEVDARGHFVLRNHTLATLMFSDISGLQLRDFNSGNILSSLTMEYDESADSIHKFKISMSTSYGLEGSLKCKRIEVLETVPCPPDGEEIN